MLHLGCRRPCPAQDRYTYVEHNIPPDWAVVKRRGGLCCSVVQETRRVYLVGKSHKDHKFRDNMKHSFTLELSAGLLLSNVAQTAVTARIMSTLWKAPDNRNHSRVKTKHWRLVRLTLPYWHQAPWNTKQPFKKNPSQSVTTKIWLTFKQRALAESVPTLTLLLFSCWNPQLQRKARETAGGVGWSPWKRPNSWRRRTRAHTGNVHAERTTRARARTV